MSTQPGKLIGVSLGPGDPGLITRAAWQQLERRDTAWVYPVRSGKTPSYAFGIIERSGLEPVAEHGALVFPMTHDGEKLARAWAKAADTVMPLLESGQDVLFLVEGDASTYATFGHLARTVRALDPRIQTPALPGVSSISAAGASTARPLAEQDDTMAIVPAAYGVSMLTRLLPDFDTLVLMKVKPILDELLDWLQQHDLLDNAHFVEMASAPDERVLSGRALLQLRGEKPGYLSLMVIHNANRVRGERISGCLKKPSATGPATMPTLPSEAQGTR